MKRLLIQLILMLILFSEGYSQSFAIKGGGNLSKISASGAEMKPGFQIGATIDIPIMAFLSFETGLSFANKGYQVSNIDLTDQNGTNLGKAKLIYNLYYIDIPFTAKASLDVGWAKIYGLFGPYLGVGMFGKWKAGSYYNENITWAWGTKSGWYDGGTFSRLDYGLMLGIGLEYKSIVLNISNEYGLANISAYRSTEYKNTSVSNRTIALSVGYKFGGR